MTRVPSLSPLVAKEVRALLPVWAATMVALAAAFVWRQRSYSDIGLVGYVAGVIVLGAHAIGHEYGHRTLPVLLAQPVSRARLFAAKFLVAGGMLATLALVASIVFTTDRFRGNDAGSTVMLPILGGVFLAPLFTMMCRGTLAGAVLGGSSPMMLWVMAVLVAWWGFGVGADALTAWVLSRWTTLALIACPILAALTWRAFNRMEALEGAPAALTLPRWRAARAGVRHRAPWRALVAKEIHLQQMTIAITLFYSLIWMIGVRLRDTAPSVVRLPMEAVLLLYCMGLTLVIGALASAEERQQGTLEMQLLQPVGALRQWAVKCVVSLGLAILLGLGLPVLLIAAFSSESGSSLAMSPALTLLVVTLTSSSLYISSLASSGVKAMVWSLPAAIGVAIFIQTVQTTIVFVSARLGTPLPVDHTEASQVAGRVLTVLLVPVLLWFGFVNHTSAEHTPRRTVTQVGIVAVLIVAGITAAGALI